MKKQVLDVGQCDYDHGNITNLIEKNFDAQVHRAHDLNGALQKLSEQSYDLILVNRKLDMDHSDGMPIIEKIKGDEAYSKIPVMLITNFPEHQQAAEAAGAVPGFGKAEYEKPETLEKLKAQLA